MSYLLDTNVLSELARPRPDARVVRWFRGVPDESLHVSVLTLGEIRAGIERLPAGAKREKLRVWLEIDLPGWFEDRLLAVDGSVADRWGRLVGEARRPIPAVDALLAATALGHGLRLVTRNVADFAFAGLEVVDPWTAEDEPLSDGTPAGRRSFWPPFSSPFSLSPPSPPARSTSARAGATGRESRRGAT